MASAEQTVESFKGQPRLPGFAAPRHYDLHLRPDLVACTFAGEVAVAVEVEEDTRFLVLNAADLDIDGGSVRFLGEGRQELQAKEIVTVSEDEILIISFDQTLPLGKGTLQMSFTGTLNDKMKGFYRSVYEYNGEKKNMAVTQFEPVDARRCFPCWDEPACKATFKITLEVPSETIALSNMPIIEEKINGPVKVLSFEQSPVMSTYLVAVVVGMFDYVEASTSDGIKVRVYTQVGKKDQGKFALDVAVRTLDLYKDYFAVPYPLPKLDMIAIPDFAAGAMENFGLVTYRETALLFDERHSAAANKQRVAVVVAHELAHQWFGNLVTMEWWTHLWLNEGFATWVSYLAADSLFPEWKVWTQFLDDAATGLRLDSLAGSHPIEVDINHAAEVDEIFDAISYRKGAAVIRMLQSYLGAESFQKALGSYIKKFAYSNAKTEDLWAVLEEVSGEPVKQLMKSWTQQQGYPVVSIKLTDQKLELQQTQFLLSGESGEGQWIVPITLGGLSNASPEKFLLNQINDTFDLSNLLKHSDAKDWIKLNVNQTGFYRVSYDEELASRLRHAIESNQLSASDKFGILDDTYSLCLACKQPLSSLLSLIAAYKNVTEYTVLSRIMEIGLKVVFVTTHAIPELSSDVKKFLISFFWPIAERLGWDPTKGESHLNAMLRGELLTVLAVLGHSLTLKEATRRFNAFLEDRDTPLLPPDIRKAAYVAVMRTVSKANKQGFENLLRVYRESELSQERVRILGAFANCPDPDVVREALDFFLTSEVRNQDTVHGLAGISAESIDIAWLWLKENWEYISKTWTGFLITRFVSSIVSHLSSDSEGDAVEEFFATRSTPAIARTLKQSIEWVRINAKWAKSIKSEQALGSILKEQSAEI